MHTETNGILQIVKPDGSHAGMGILIDDEHVITCAHVINQSRLCPDFHIDRPDESKSFAMQFRFPDLRTTSARVVKWGMTEYPEPVDLAVLKLDAPKPEGVKCAVFSFQNAATLQWKVFGQHRGEVRPSWTTETGSFVSSPIGNGRIQLDGIGMAGRWIDNGDSGAAVWCTSLGAVIGMAVTKHPANVENRISFMISTEAIDQFWHLEHVSKTIEDNSRQVRVSLAHLPAGAQPLIGRESEIEQLNDAWESGRVRVCTIVASGGEGKTALIRQWLHELTTRDFNSDEGAGKVFCWNFFSPEPTETSDNPDIFIEEALRFFGDPLPHRGTPSAQGERLARYLAITNSVVVLDGMELVQHGPVGNSTFRAGAVKDRSVKGLLAGMLSEKSGLCIITTRVAIADLADVIGPQVLVLTVHRLSLVTSVALLRSLGVTGTNSQLEYAANKVQRHALALSLLGRYLIEAHDGKAEFAVMSSLIDQDRESGGQARQILTWYTQWLFSAGTESEGGQLLAIASLLGLFDRRTESGALKKISAPPSIDGLTEPLIKLTDAVWKQRIRRLRTLGLVDSESPSEPEYVDAHPIIREYFAETLREVKPESTREAHTRIFDFFSDSTPERPHDVKEMSRICHGLEHACKAGLAQRAFDQVYWPRVRRGNEAYIDEYLGAFYLDISTLTGFFDEPFSHIRSDLSAQARVRILNCVGWNLRALGRLGDAETVLEAAMSTTGSESDVPDWNHVAMAGAQLTQIQFYLGYFGRLARALPLVEAASERLSDSFWSLVCIEVTLFSLGAWDEDLQTISDRLWELPRFTEDRNLTDYGMALFWWHEFLLAEINAVPSEKITNKNVLPRALSTNESPTESESAAARRIAQVERWIDVHRKWLQEEETNGKAVPTIALPLIDLSLGQIRLMQFRQCDADHRDDLYQQARQLLLSSYDQLFNASVNEFVVRALVYLAYLECFAGDHTAAAQYITAGQDLAHNYQMLVFTIELHALQSHLCLQKYKIGAKPEDLTAATEAYQQAITARTATEAQDALGQYQTNTSALTRNHTPFDARFRSADQLLVSLGLDFQNSDVVSK